MIADSRYFCNKSFFCILYDTHILLSTAEALMHQCQYSAQLQDLIMIYYQLTMQVDSLMLQLILVSATNSGVL